MAGYTNSVGAGDFDMLLLKTNSAGNFNVTTNVSQTSTSTIQLNLFPNPVMTYFSIKNLGSIESASTIEIVNMIGQTVLSNTIQINQFDVSTLQNGLYLVLIKNDNGQILGSTKLMK